ncbi:MAG: Arc family DNA-binding protein [Mesorhizobium sp.]|uniref:Arc family DNA-binding protein n=1 Tax=unclassified Mesorhizobium TaxID=325217 RepID=UPI000FCC29E4|nr:MULTISPECIES: Arc family DNA-binding protein [unclassified Mesorhizobium]RUV75949.1 Arc family DNA-binding protein [Mesorhizobium sp. M5C.F.Cr.IN.023.01.1.1]RWF85765.1 MAG: Arc family DNA-binding protein [Mesorhizobium sp.]RWF95263.1 MAG: Arc family DNA-binding protein [Mesorhizobium sp.]RWI39904.1 MAG: Arc family DNA-binding protein [Mesorhizobium sp.]RWI45232.1 MAG: Arc family DNA-binding protein [Mesorhizobium sp.]
MAQQSKSRKLDQYIVRFPDGMRDRLKELAEEHNRSLNAEIIDHIHKGLEHERLLSVIDSREREIALLSTQSTELIESTTRREERLYTDLVTLRRLQPENEALKETIKSKDEIIENLQESISLMRMMNEMQRLNVSLLFAILDEAEAGSDDLLQKTIAHRKIVPTPEQEKDAEQLVLEMRRVAKIKSKTS